MGYGPGRLLISTHSLPNAAGRSTAQMSRNLFETETLAFAAQLGPASEFLGGFGGHQQPGGREQRAESLAFSEGLGESAGKAAAFLMLLPAVQADSDKLASVHKMVQALSAASQGQATMQHFMGFSHAKSAEDFGRTTQSRTSSRSCSIWRLCSKRRPGLSSLVEIHTST